MPQSYHKLLSSANDRIGSLNDEVSLLHTAVREVSVQRDEAVAASAHLEDELNTCYYVAAPGSELKEHDILESGFLRKTRLMAGDFDREVFVAADKRSLASLPLGVKKARVLTNHPGESYRLVERDGLVSLCILDSERFWSLGNYLVVQTY